jgi:GH25 family lysozyme M1 (1,4-beta-N-acetylmuramidase)
MTTFIPDVSQYQSGLTVATLKNQGFTGLSARCSIGAHTDREFSRFRAEAKLYDMPFAAYHFLKSDGHTRIADQVAACEIALGDKSIPCMLDWERDTNSQPVLSDAKQFLHGAAYAGLRFHLNYLPHWYWSEIGRPDSPLPLVASSYGSNPVGIAQDIYPGDSHWPADYAHSFVALWQFGSNIVVPGYAGRIDCNASLAPIAELIQHGWFKDWTPEIPNQFDTFGDDEMILVSADVKDYPQGQWPGVFLLSGNTVKHVVSNDDLQSYKAAGIQGPVTISAREFDGFKNVTQ